MEISIVGANPHAAEFWGWEIAAYLFLGGLVAGLMVLGGWFRRREPVPPRSVTFWAPALAPVLLAIGMLALFLDLERKLHAFRFYLTVQITSPMSWGAWILLLVFPVAGLSVLPYFGRRLATANIVLGTALGIYTGILLGAFGARPLWNTPLLGPLFLVSGVSSAAALLMLLEKSHEWRERLAAIDSKLIAVEAALLVLMLIGLATGGAAQKAAAGLVLGGAFTGAFWVAVVLIGLALPVFMEYLHRSGRAQATAFAPVFVLAGGVALRAVILFAGQASGWSSL